MTRKHGVLAFLVAFAVCSGVGLRLSQGAAGQPVDTYSGPGEDAAASTGAPLQINHQGVISVDGTRFEGFGAFWFAIVDPETNTNVWTNDLSNLGTPEQPEFPVQLTVSNGVYTVRLGDTTLPSMQPLAPEIFDDSSLNLRIWFDDGIHGPQLLSPDHVLTSTPYAFKATDAQTVQGLGPAEIGTMVGMMVPFYHPQLALVPETDPYDLIPRNWVICDGSVVGPGHPRAYTEDEVDPSFWLAQVPDMRGHFVRGQVDGQAHGQTGGADSHRHHITGLTGSIADSGGNPGGHWYRVRDDNQGWTSAVHLRVDGGASPQEGQHRHDLNLHSQYTSNVPAYVGTLYIIRIK